eukprot:NODE_5858_length_631_cov_74.353952_g5461_i0.p2 GENE.NODE_5858_length_631_cov_74.353952_g5461_i0~~NODE_5858_length_631_cov_74.353952_g5461_i0.p2  ORF type:complete len:120 (+),score=33.65 NODE_5858_length_631_cov_74.353952_g5461_i0:134-493(+)
MAIPANLVVNITFNPPTICIAGPIKDTTIGQLSSIFPLLCSSSPGQRSTAAFTKEESPVPHWSCTLSSQYCNESMGQTQLMLAIMDKLEEEGGWKLKASNALNHDDKYVTYKFFFVQKM